MKLSAILLLAFLGPLAQDERLRPPRSPGAGTIDVALDVKHAIMPPFERVFLLGDLPGLGGGNVARALPMQSEDGLHWRISVALPAGETIRFHVSSQVPYRFRVTKLGIEVDDRVRAQLAEKRLAREMRRDV